MSLLAFAEAQYQAAQLQLEAARRLLDFARQQETIPAPPALQGSIIWVYRERLAELTGLNHDMIYHRRYNGDWIEGVHFRKERPGRNSRLLYNTETIGLWLQGNRKPHHSPPASKSTTANSGSGSSSRANAATNP